MPTFTSQQPFVSFIRVAFVALLILTWSAAPRAEENSSVQKEKIRIGNTCSPQIYVQNRKVYVGLNDDWHVCMGDMRGQQLYEWTDLPRGQLKVSPDGRSLYVLAYTFDKAGRLVGNGQTILYKVDLEKRNVVAQFKNPFRVWAGSGDKIPLGTWTVHNDDYFAVGYSDGPVPDFNHVGTPVWDFRRFTDASPVSGPNYGHRRVGLSPEKMVLAISPDGNTVATGGEDNRIILWDRKGNLKRILAGHDFPIQEIVFLDDDATLVSFEEFVQDRRSKVMMWDWKNGKVKADLGGLGGVRNPFCLKAVAKRFLVCDARGDEKEADRDMQLILFDAAGKRIARTKFGNWADKFQLPPSVLLSETQVLVSARETGETIVYNQKLEVLSKRHASLILKLGPEFSIFRADAPEIMMISRGPDVIYFLDYNKGTMRVRSKPGYKIADSPDLHIGPVIHPVFSSGKGVYLLLHNNPIRGPFGGNPYFGTYAVEPNAPRDRELGRFKAIPDPAPLKFNESWNPSGHVIDKTGTKIAMGWYNGPRKTGLLRLMDTTGRALWSKEENVAAVAFSPDGLNLAYVGSKAKDADDFKPVIRILKLDGTLVWEKDNLDIGALSPLPQLSFSPDGSLLVAAGEREVWLLNVKDRTAKNIEKIKKTDEPGRYPVQGAVFSPDGRTFAYATHMSYISIRNAAGVETGRIEPSHIGTEPRQISYSGDGKVIMIIEESHLLLVRVDTFARMKLWVADNGEWAALDETSRTFDGSPGIENMIFMTNDGLTMEAVPGKSRQKPGLLGRFFSD